MISERIKAALARSKNRGKLGVRHPLMRSKKFRRRLQAAAAAALNRAAMERAEAYRIHIEWALSQPGLHGKPITFRGASEKLNALQIPSPMGGRWDFTNVVNIAVRLRLRERPIRVSREVLQRRVDALWKAHPDCTGQQVVKWLKPEHSICIARAWIFLRNCREAAVKRSRIHKQTGWRIDWRTGARIRIAEIWKRSPELTAKQIIQRLRPRYSVSVPWVQKALRECWRASSRHSAEQQRIGRRSIRAR